MCLKEFHFPDCWKVSLVVSIFKNVGERSAAKNYHPVSLLVSPWLVLLPYYSVVSKVFEKLVNNKFVNHLEKCVILSNFSMDLGLLDEL